MRYGRSYGLRTLPAWPAEKQYEDLTRSWAKDPGPSFDVTGGLLITHMSPLSPRPPFLDQLGFSLFLF